MGCLDLCTVQLDSRSVLTAPFCGRIEYGEPLWGFPVRRLLVGRLYGVAALYPERSVTQPVKPLSTLRCFGCEASNLATQLLDHPLLCVDQVIQLCEFLVTATEPSATLYA